VPQRLAAQLEQFSADLDRVTSEEALYDLQVAYLGKKGSITALKAEMGKIPPADRKAFGAAWNSARDSIDAALATRRQFLKDEARRRDLARRVDLTMPPLRPPPGTLHPLAQTRRRLSESFMRLGFDVAVGPHVESGRYNFDDLNMPSDHPARDMADTLLRVAAGRARGRRAGPADPHLAGPGPDDAQPDPADPHHRPGHDLPPRRRRDPQPDVPPDRGPLRRRAASRWPTSRPR
jgi:phenylalanyl-tRNA synthetase alpha subunit